KEVQQLKSEMQRISQTTRFGNTQLLNGSGKTFDFQVGINNVDAEDRIKYDSAQTNANISELGVDGLDFTSKEGAQSALAVLDEAQTKVSGYRANLGALQNRLQSTSDNLGVMNENAQAANSRIRDTDVAAATSDMTKNSILLNANTSVLSQSNQIPNMAMKLLG
ncbi:MAG: flagellin FliC, partial [Proteobacteria bacterium]